MKYIGKSTCFFTLGVISISVFGQSKKLPNVVFVLADEWRGQAVGYAGATAYSI